MLKRHAPSRQKRRGRLPLPPRSSPGASTSPTPKRSKTAPLLGGKDTTCDITTSSTITSTANGNCEAGGLRSSRRSARLSVVVGRAERVLGRLSGLGPAPGRKSPTSTVKAAIDGEETELSDLIHEQVRPEHVDKTQHQASVSKSRGSPNAHQGEAETVAARSRGRRSSGRPEAVGPTSRHPSSSRHPASRPKKHRGPSRAGVVEEEAEMDWREPVLSPQKSPAASPRGETAPNGRGGVGLSRGRRGRGRDAVSNNTGAGGDAEGAARGVAVEDSRGGVRGKARCDDGGVLLMKPAAAATAVPNTTTAIAIAKATATATAKAKATAKETTKAPATATARAPAKAKAKATAKATATTKATAKSTPKAKAKASAVAAAAAAAATAAAAASIGSNGSIPNGVGETKGMLTLPVPPPKKEELPRCPYPGHENVSWTCRACGGAVHHLTSRFAMEPLQRVHGFKVHRVPNDGDCFFSSIKAALEAGSGMCQDSGGAASAAAAVAAAGLTVAKMREWVAEETGEEQLAFYTLQAKANPEDRWLDFVRPLDERVRSDDEEDEEEEEREGRGRRGRRKDEEKSEEREGGGDDSSEQEGDSCEEESESASQWSETTTVASSEAGTQRSRRQGRKEDDPGVGRSATTTTTAAAVRGVRRNRRSGASAAGESEADNARPPSDEKPTDQLEAASSTNTEAVQNGLALPRRRGRPRSKGTVAVPKVAAAGVGATPTTATTKTTQARKGNACSMRSSRGAATNKSLISSRLRTRKSASHIEQGGEEKVAGEEEGAKGQDAAGRRKKGGEKGEEKEEAEEEEGEEEEEELPEVKTLDELRQFVRLEGSVVGHGRCMWADTFAHHVVSRRLGLTILFVDMEREKSAWPYRVLARADEDGKSEQEERFVVLKREPNHFVLVKTAPPPADKEGGKAGDCGGEGDVNGVGAPLPLSGWGQACFRRSELPEAVKRLWQIEPEVAGPVLPPPPPPRPTGTGQKSPSTTATVTAASEIGGS